MSTREYFTTKSLGKTRHLTPDGFLLCESVPIGRTGVQLYCDADGLPSNIVSDGQGLIRIHRDADEVFHPNTITSFNGKPVTNDHPPEKVCPENWKDYSVGVVINPRRGDGKLFNDDFLYADLLITDADAIKDVLSGKKEVSCGYDAEYAYVRPGEGKQRQIIGNHVALVDKGRCGPTCAIGDKAMTTKTNPAWVDRILAAHATGDAGKLVEELEKIAEMLGETSLGNMHKKFGYSAPPGLPSGTKDEGKEDMKEDDKKDDDKKDDWSKDVASLIKDAVKSHMATYDSQIKSLQRAVAILATKDADGKEDDGPDAEKDDDKGVVKEDEKKETKDALTGDSSGLAVMWQEVISRAEFLAPGIRHPTFDAKKPAQITMDSMCKFRRKVLDEAMKEEDTAAAIQQIVGGKPKLSTMTCDAITMVYNGSSELMRKTNTDSVRPGEGMNYKLGAQNVAGLVSDINKSNKSFWANQGRRV